MADDEAEQAERTADDGESPPVTPAGTAMPSWVGDKEKAVRRQSPRRRNLRPLVAGVLGVLGAWWGWRVVFDSGPGRTPGQAVSGFFEAQRTRDCDRLIDVLTEASWSQDGRLGRDEFLDQCADAVVGYRPTVERVEVEVVNGDGQPSDHGDRAIVHLGPRTYSDDEHEGTLVRQDGEWRVEADPDVLRIGRSVEDTLRGYIEAYNDADCERMLDYLTEATWSQSGALTEDQFTERCIATVGGEQERRPLVVSGVEVKPSQDDDRVTAAVALSRAGEQRVIDQGPETTAFVRDGLTWKFAGIANGSGEVAAAADAATPVPVFEVIELQDRLVDEIRRPEEACLSYGDFAAPHPAGDHPARSVRRDFVSCFGGVMVTLYGFDDDEAARGSAETMVATELADLPPTAEDLAEVDDRADPADLERSAASYRPNRQTPVPGIADALGVQTLCSVDGCSGAVVFGVRDSVLVRIDVSSGDPDLADAAAILQAQLERI